MNTLCGDAETVLYSVSLVVLLIFHQEAFSLVRLLRSRLARKACKEDISKIEASPPQQQMKPDESKYWYDSTPPDLDPSPDDESQEFASDDSPAQTPCPDDDSQETDSDDSYETDSDTSTAQSEDKLVSVLPCSLSGSSCGKESISSPIRGDAKSSGTPIQQRNPLRLSLLKKQVPERKLDKRVASAMAMRVRSRLQRQSLARSNPNTARFRQQQKSTSMDAVKEDEAKSAGFHLHRRSSSMDSVMEDESMSSPVRSLTESRERSAGGESSPRGPALNSQSMHGSPERSLVKRVGHEKESGSGYTQFSTEGSLSRNGLQLSRSSHVGSPNKNVQLSKSCNGAQRSKSGTFDSADKPVTRAPRMNRRMSVSDARMLLRMRCSGEISD
jgi:hypothetical protein